MQLLFVEAMNGSAWVLAFQLHQTFFLKWKGRTVLSVTCLR